MTQSCFTILCARSCSIICLLMRLNFATKSYIKNVRKKYAATLNELQRIVCLTKNLFSVNENLTAFIVTC